MTQNENDPATDLIIRGKGIRFDENGLACLNDIWKAAGFTKYQQPGEWSRLPTTVRKMERVLELVTGKSRDYDPEDMRKVFRTVRGRNAGTFADIRLALDYAEYLNPKLAIEVKEVFLRYKGGDATLADEVLQKASAEDNLWAANRALVRAARLTFTHELHERGVVEPKHYAMCTDTTYRNLFGMSAKELKSAHGLPANANLRDGMKAKDLAFLAASEALAVERMEDEESHGFTECDRATGRAASAIRGAIDTDRKSRQRRLVG